MNELPAVQIYILSHNRPALLIETLNSCLQIQYQNLEIIISDNSSNDDVAIALKAHAESSRFRVKRRNHTKHFSEHVNIILGEITAPYFMVFHDDDIMFPHLVEHYVKIMESNLDVSACVGNVLLMKGFEKTSLKFFDAEADQLITEGRNFIDLYFDKKSSHPPFPFHLYRSSSLKSVRLSPLEGGIHSDTPFLYKVMKAGALFWSSEVVGYYRLHDSNMSKKINIRSLNSMYHFFKAREPLFATIVENYKLRNLVHYFKQNRFNLISLLKSTNQRALFYRASVYVIQNAGSYISRTISILKKKKEI